MVVTNRFLQIAISENEVEKTFFRIIYKGISPALLDWHTDDHSRVINVISKGKGWKFQYDNMIPISLQLVKKSEISVKKGRFHRVIRDLQALPIEDLVLHIRESKID